MGMLMNNFISWSNDMGPVKSTNVRQHKKHRAKSQEFQVWIFCRGNWREVFHQPWTPASSSVWLKTLVNICESKCFKHGFPLKTLFDEVKHTDIQRVWDWRGWGWRRWVHVCARPDSCHPAGFSSSIVVMALAAFTLKSGWWWITMVLS